MSAEQFIQDGTDEFIRESGFVTIEFSTSPATLERIQPLLDLESERLTHLNAKWVAASCETCRGQDPDCHIHVSIEVS